MLRSQLSAVLSLSVLRSPPVAAQIVDVSAERSRPYAEGRTRGRAYDIMRADHRLPRRIGEIFYASLASG
jgi:hypothetical protein